MRYFKNTSWLFGEKMLRMLVGLFVGLWVARYLGPVRFGTLSYALSFVGMFSVFAALGLDGIVIRELVKSEDLRDEIIGTTFWLKLIGSLVTITALVVVVLFSSDDTNTNTLVFIIAGAMLFQSFNVVDFYFQSKASSKYVVIANVITLFSSSLVKMALIINEAPLIAFAWVVFFDSVILACWLTWFLCKSIKLDFQKLTLHWSMAKEFLRDSWPLILSGVASMLNMRVDQVMLANMADFEVVGSYAAAVRISELWFVVPGVVSTSIYPAIISAKQQGHTVYRNRVIKTVMYMLIFALPIAIMISVYSGMLVQLLYGDEFVDAGQYLAMHIWSGVPYVVLFVYSHVALIENLTRLSLYISIYAVMANLTLNTLLIPIYGGMGAASATLFVAWSSVLLTVYLVEKKSNILKASKEK